MGDEDRVGVRVGVRVVVKVGLGLMTMPQAWIPCSGMEIMPQAWKLCFRH